jgi:hypothetical protein
MTETYPNVHNSRSKLIELTVVDLQRVSGGVVAGEWIESNHKDDTGSSSGPAKASHISGSSWVGGKILG